MSNWVSGSYVPYGAREESVKYGVNKIGGMLTDLQRKLADSINSEGSNYLRDHAHQREGSINHQPADWSFYELEIDIFIEGQTVVSYGVDFTTTAVTSP